MRGCTEHSRTHRRKRQRQRVLVKVNKRGLMHGCIQGGIMSQYYTNTIILYHLTIFPDTTHVMYGIKKCHCVKSGLR